MARVYIGNFLHCELVLLEVLSALQDSLPDGQFAQAQINWIILYFFSFFLELILLDGFFHQGFFLDELVLLLRDAVSVVASHVLAHVGVFQDLLPHLQFPSQHFYVPLVPIQDQILQVDLLLHLLFVLLEPYLLYIYLLHQLLPILEKCEFDVTQF